MASISYDSPLRSGIASFVECEDHSSKEQLRKEIRTLHHAAEITADLVIHQFEKTEAILTKFQSTSAQLQAVLDAASQIAIILAETLYPQIASTLVDETGKGIKPWHGAWFDRIFRPD